MRRPIFPPNLCENLERLVNVSPERLEACWRSGGQRRIPSTPASGNSPYRSVGPSREGETSGPGMLNVQSRFWTGPMHWGFQSKPSQWSRDTDGS